MIVTFEKKVKVRLVGVAGAAGSGKDAVFNAWKNTEFNRRVKQGTFAGPLKQIAESVFGFSYEQLHDKEQKEVVDQFWEMTPRKFMQLLGTEACRRGIRDDIWIKMAERLVDDEVRDVAHTMNFYRNDPKPVNIGFTDCRFANEANFIRDRGGIIIQVLRPGQQLISENQHASEKGLPDELVDFTVMNWEGKLAGAAETFGLCFDEFFRLTDEGKTREEAVVAVKSKFNKPVL